MKKLFLLGLALILLLIVTGVSAVKEPVYHAVYLGRGYEGFTPNAIRHGVICGGFDHEAAIWKDGTISLLEIPGYEFSRALALNDSGAVIVSAYNAEGGPSSPSYFLFEKSGLTAINFPEEHGYPNAINNSGQVVGLMHSHGPPFGFIWRNGQMTDVIEIAGLADINNAGIAVGEAVIGASNRAFFYDGKVNLLETPIGSSSAAFSINDRGQIVGVLSAFQEDWAAALWEDGHLTILPSLGGRVASAEFINNRGQIIGEAEDPQGHRYACLWQHGQVIILEEHLEETLRITDIYGLDNQGNILCYGRKPDYSGGFFLLDPR